MAQGQGLRDPRSGIDSRPMPPGGLRSASDAGTEGSRRVARPRSSAAMARTGAQRVAANGGAPRQEKKADTPTGRDPRPRLPVPERTSSGRVPEGGFRAAIAPRTALSGSHLERRSGTGGRGCRRPLPRGAAPVICRPGMDTAPQSFVLTSCDLYGACVHVCFLVVLRDYGAAEI